ncbi:pyridoxamine 5'-phosphate oxidase family protein [Sphingopyxis macrogoltabida]|uniref:Pyridoxamine 5-phosphate oxidase n=1 Tax=Sphingopyxis macrogoltabida TaxID=33050 RepID=A0AAC9AVU3_SPHMC|nr:pyridoxamine 5'-phosphate oxidase family protein [Sphingopyxis macrogoltabida]ALJ14155.1 pyridoxamine 5'-phosphate oxidase-like FMN-binding protein [Sphingopyxis macrogoltabida]AMU90421.1 pyridoxamine 5-phosphate oxidase [Sphingopyxis macrogoltabida]
MSAIDSLAVLEGVIGKTPAPVNLKVIDHADANARRWLAASPLMFAGFGDGQGIAITLGGGDPGFASAADPAVLAIPLDLIDDPALAVPGAGFGSLFLIPGVGETLRINGRVVGTDGGILRVAIEECYGHCAKALIRSDFWSAEPLGEWPGDPGSFVNASRFMALATVDADGGADLSPKGDPAGSMARMGAGGLWFADRPGNRRADSFRNIVVQPRIAAALLIPGSTGVVSVRGQARLTADESARAAFAVRDKTPLLAARIDDVTMEMRASAALGRARLWPAAAAPGDIRPARMFADHVRLNKDKGLAARLAGAFVSVPGLMERGLAKDYKDNLY